MTIESKDLATPTALNYLIGLRHEKHIVKTHLFKLQQRHCFASLVVNLIFGGGTSVVR